jgi:xanthine dehydrogenase accessory factor
MAAMTELWQTMTSLSQRGEPFVCVTLVKARGSVPQEVGAKLIAGAQGRISGTIGGGRVEQAVIQRAAELLQNADASPCTTVDWNLQRDIGMTCGGEVTFLFEIHRPAAWQIVIFGAGHVAQALVRTLIPLPCRVLVLDTRPEMLALVPPAANVEARLQEPLVDAVPGLPDRAYVLLMTQGHRSDKPVLEQILKTRQFPYLGVIGSASKAAVLRRELRESGIEGEPAFRCPMGLPIGRDTPEEIAISIAAELLQVRGS